MKAWGGKGTGRGTLLRVVVLLSAVGVAAALLAPPATGHADARSDYLVRLLQTSKTFRVRAQAALALGRVTEEPTVVQALVGALRDEHPAVRASAAASLGALGDASALTALHAAERDSDSTVRAAATAAVASVEKVSKTRAVVVQPPPPPPSTEAPVYYVGVGVPGSAVGLDNRTLTRARAYLVAAVENIDGVVLAPEKETPAAARTVMKKRNLVGYYLDTSIVKVEPSANGVRAVVSVIVGTYPGHDMRVILQGAATVEGGNINDSARAQAIEGALSGALRRLPQALSAARGNDGI